LSGLRKQTYQGPSALYIVDNSTSTNSYNYLSSLAQEAKIIRNENNDGFAKGNNDAILEALKMDAIILFYLIWYCA
jgi:GT2 family glycosyltransferase